MKDLNAEKLLRIVEWRKKHRPIPWIAREEEITLAEVKTVLRLAGEVISPNSRDISADKWDMINYWYVQGASLNIIQNEVGVDPRTVKRYFPDAGWGVGGAGRAANVRQMYQDLDRIDSTGAMSKRRQRT